MKTTKTFIIRYLPALLWALQIFIFSCVSVSNPLDIIPQCLLGIFWDTIFFGKRLYLYLGVILHFINFAILAFLFARAFVWKGPLKCKALIFAFAIACLVGLSDEIHQIFTPGRSYKVLDLFVNSAGAAFGVFAFSYLHAKLRSVSPGRIKKNLGSLGR